MNLPLTFPSQNYTVWDLETSGLDPKTDKILEIGWLCVRDGKETERGSVLLNHPNFEVPEVIVNITGITTEMIRTGVAPREALNMLLERLNQGEVPHVTHNGLRFDCEFLLQALWPDVTIGDYETFETNLYRNMIDTAVLFKAGKLGRRRRFNETFKEWGTRVMEERVYGLKYNVGVCCDELGIEKGQQHRALGDVLLTNEIYKKLCFA